MSVEAVKEYLKPFGLSDQVLELAESSATVELAAPRFGYAACPHRQNAVLLGGGRRPSS